MPLSAQVDTDLSNFIEVSPRKVLLRENCVPISDSYPIFQFRPHIILEHFIYCIFQDMESSTVDSFPEEPPEHDEETDDFHPLNFSVSLHLF